MIIPSDWCAEEHRWVVTAGTASTASLAASCFTVLGQGVDSLRRKAGTAMMQLSVKLVHQATAGDEHAWEELVKQYGGLLKAIANNFRLTPDQAADAAQTTWLRLVQNISKVREPAKLGGWLASTMRRECIRLINDRGRQQLADSWKVERLSNSDSPEVQLLLAERDVLLWSAVDRLPARQRQVLAALSGTPAPSYREVSTALSMAIGSIGPTRLRALRRMRDLLADTGGFQNSCVS